MSMWPRIRITLPQIFEHLFRDPARPVEILSLLALVGWAEFLLLYPNTFRGPNYESFSAFGPNVWAAFILATVAAQFAAFFSIRSSETLRFVAMAMQAGLWTIVSYGFWTSDAAPLAARTTTSIAFVTVLTGAYLGWASKKS